MPEENGAQKRFDERYITSHEIEKELNITRSTLFVARKRGFLPDPIQVTKQKYFIWEREAVRPYIDAWKLTLNCRRNRSGA